MIVGGATRNKAKGAVAILVRVGRSTSRCRWHAHPEAMTVRRSTAEHPFGTIKAWMGATHFLCRRLPRVSAEMSLHVLAYNLKRVMKIMGTGPLIEALRA